MHRRSTNHARRDPVAWSAHSLRGVEPMANGANTIEWWKKLILVAYFLAAAASTLYAAYGLWDAEPRPRQTTPVKASLAEKQTDGTPELTAIDPSVLTIGTGQVGVR